MCVRGGGGRVVGFEGLTQLRLHLVKQQIDALLQAFVLQHQRVANHHAAHARVFLGELQQQGHDPARLHGACGLTVCHLPDQADHGLVDKINQSFKHLRLAGKVAVQSRFAHANLGSQTGRGHALGTRLLQHGGQGLQNLQTPLARTRAFACRRRFIVCKSFAGCF